VTEQPHVDVPADGEDLEEIEVEPLEEPGEPDPGAIDPDDTYTEGRA
jgi:hypothetical protein